MKLDIYKGFTPEFYKSIKEPPLINKNIYERLDITKYQKNNIDELQVAIIQKEGHYWITYEEYAFINRFIEQRCLTSNLQVCMIKNNIYPEIYPICYSISDNILEEIEDNRENKPFEELSDIASKIVKIYSNVVKIDGENYVTFYNDEIGNEAITNIINFYDKKLIIEEMQDEVDYIINISNELEDFIKNVNEINKHNFVNIGLDESCDTITSRMIKDSYTSYFANIGKPIHLFNWSEKLKEKEQIIERFKEIAKDVIKIPNFVDFRDIDFYENIDFSRNIIKISQQSIMYDLVNEAQKAYSNEIYRDIFVTAPTGSGKSIMFQIPAIYLAEKYNKLTIIIEPIKGLMEDQKEKLHSLGYKHAEFLNSDIASSIEKEQIISRVKNGDVNLLYLSPETLLSYTIDTIVGDREIGLLIVDEAHIVTTWGVGFRPDYWYLGNYINRLRTKANYWGAKKQNDRKIHQFPICTFTATAVYGGKDDTFKETSLSLYLKAPIKYIGNLRRNNIKFLINNYEEKYSMSNYETKKVQILSERLYNWTENNNKTIIYFPYHKQAQELFDTIGKFRELDIFKENFGIYTGQSDRDTKQYSIRKFINNEKCIMLATKAFGMGIDINDIENVYHYAVSGNLSDYVQEIGRVARKDNMIGYAITDYFDNDKQYMNKFFGMSQIRHYQISKVLQIVYDVYKSKQNRNFLVTPRMFFGIFGKDEEKATNRLKIALLMIEKDLYEKFSFKVLISRPRSIFTNAFVVIDRDNSELVLNGKYGKFFTFNSKGKYKYPNNDGLYTTDFGDVYKIDLKSIWEDFYPNISFAKFKYDFYTKNGNNCNEIRPFIRNRVKVTIHTKNNTPFSKLKELLYDELNFINKKLNEFNRNYFTTEEFANKLEEKYGKSLKQKLIANSFLEIIDENREIYKERTTEDGTTEYVISNSSIETKVYHLVKNCGLLKELSQSNNVEHSCFLPSDKNEGNLKAFRLLSLLDLITYEVIGGDNPEIFVRLNDPEKIRKMVLKQIYYSNDYVDRAREKQYRSVKIIDYFFRNLNNDTDRWNYIEDYFAGEDIIKELENEIPEEIVFKELKDCIDIDKSYSLCEYNNWNEIVMFIDNEYSPVIKKISDLKINIPDYSSAVIIVDGYKLNCVMVWLEKNIVILDEDTKDIIIEICKKIGWTAFKISNIDYNKLCEKMKG